MKISNNEWFNNQVEEICNEPRRYKKSKYHQRWESLVKDNKEAVHNFYKYLIQFLDNVIQAKKKGDKTLDERLLKFMDIFGTFEPKNYKIEYVTDKDGYRDRVYISIFSEYSDIILEKIKILMEFENYDILPNDELPFSDFAKIIVSLLEMSSYHTHFIDDTQKTKFAPIIIPFVKKVQSRSTLFLINILKHHEEPISQYVEIIFYGLENLQENDGIFNSLAFDMFYIGHDSSYFEYKNAYKILQKFLESKKTFNADEAEFLLYSFFINPLDIDTDKESKESFELRWIKAVKHLAKSLIVSKSVQLLLKNFPECKYTEILNKLLVQSIEVKNKPRVFEIKKNPNVVFHDLGLKLWIIDVLMYQKEVLKPKLTLEAFKDDYLKRQITQEDGYQIIPEIKAYFKKLDISIELLSKIEEIEMDYGIGGGAEIINHLWRFYDTGCGDEFIKVTDKAIKDLDKLPNLKKIIGLEYSNPSKKLQKALKERGIELVDYEDFC